MIYCQLNGRVSLPAGKPLTLGQAARVIAPTPAEHLPLFCPDKAGVWRITPVDLLPVLHDAFPGEQVTFLGAEACYVHRIRPTRHDHFRLLRTAAAFLILLLGSALGLAWFHSDVDMPGAMEEVYRLFTGQPVTDERLITIPYIIGVALGTAVFYALGSRNAVTPLDVKLSDYRQDLERAEAKHVE